MNQNMHEFAWVLACSWSSVYHWKIVYLETTPNVSGTQTSSRDWKKKKSLEKFRKRGKKENCLLEVLWSSVVRFWRIVLDFEADKVWNRIIPYKYLELTNQMLFYCIIIHNFYNFNKKEINKRFYLVSSGNILDNSVCLWDNYDLK